MTNYKIIVEFNERNRWNLLGDFCPHVFLNEFLENIILFFKRKGK
jgi:hypothetical protein